MTAQVQALAVAPTTIGARGELSLVLLEAPERDLPLELRLEAGPVALDENRLDWSAVADPLALQPRVRASFTAPSEPGSYVVEGRVRYWVCDERWCRRKHATLQWTISAEAPAQPRPNTRSTKAGSAERSSKGALLPHIHSKSTTHRV